jgi:hypothetical protein
MKFGGCAAIAAMALLVSGCGGGGESGSGSTTEPTTGATPITPLPTPSPTYATFGADQPTTWRAAPPFVLTEVTANSATQTPIGMAASFQVGVVEAVISGKPDFSARLGDFVRGKFASLSASDVFFDMEAGLAFSKGNADFSIASMGISFPTISNYKYRYLAQTTASLYYPSADHANQYTESRYDFLIGSKTEYNDLPMMESSYSGSVIINYANLDESLSSNPFLSGTFRLSNTGGLTGRAGFRITLASGEVQSFYASLSGSLDQQTHMLSGDIAIEDDRYAGKFQGFLYGPKGKELGLLFTLKRKDGQFSTSGVLLANKAEAL